MMDILTLLLIAVGLAMDSFSVSITSGLSLKSPRIRDGLKIGAFFGFFQAFMPILGWLGALTLIDFISDYDHWAAFFLLLLIGFKMIRESAAGEHGGLRRINMLTCLVLLGLSVATSIDALAVGATLAFLKVKILSPVVMFGAVTFLLSFSGMYLGNRIGKIVGRKIEGLGGAILILIAVMILLEHLF
jgi:putative Mn2+ efflux pump MntP